MKLKLKRLWVLVLILIVVGVALAAQWLETTFDGFTLTYTMAIAQSIFLQAEAAQIYLGDGTDGALTVTTPDTIVNAYTYLTGDEVSGEDTITVNDASSFTEGDEILIWQCQVDEGTVPAANMGYYEFNRILSIASNDMLLKTVLADNLYSGTFDANPSEVTQVVRIPQYTSVTVNSSASITAPAYDGYKGGVVIFRATGDVIINGSINVSQKGYRGGSAAESQGEGWPGRGNIVSTANNGNGGGGDNRNTGGSGGGYGTAGESNGWSTGGVACGQPDLSDLYFGGGGGRGYSSGPGNIGGGAIIIYGERIVLGASAFLLSSGGGAGSEGGGGGGGGPIYLLCGGADIGIVKVTGEGGIVGGDGGSGGVGRIAVKSAVTRTTTSPAHNQQDLNFEMTPAFAESPTHDCIFTRGWGTMDWNWNETQTLSFKVETKAADSGWDLDAASDVTKGQDISGLTSVTDGHRYIRFKAILTTIDNSESPELEDVTILYLSEPDKIEWISVR